ncbi:dihydrodipicolinate synthase family protein [Sediminibacterium sp.]|jgi:1-pyrroline-4-hydroxy-2-carboxylate deaminase|uniref:dihydrodipicolinate synthase family protein n=1 Tax=Sediminibacterium sp. TaxID=1917865 RepID=UPI0025D9B20F|nr:dihydrodipicolinate synthase family protein [Sediminibacterium sp.]MBW0177274.1 dihydrodipicolinate synthase family protein [Sediminibacterium sp.]
MANITWKGVYPALLTPFKADDSVDFDVYKTNLQAQMDAGVDGIILGGSLGEASSLSNEEKRDLLFYSKEIVPQDFPVIINIAEQTTKAAIQLAQDSQKNGADGLMLLPPMRYNADSKETLEYFKAVATATSLPIMIYNNPVDYKIMVTLDMFEAMVPYKNIQAVKESTRDVSNVIRMHNRFGSRFSVLTGVDPLAMESLCVGADGWVAGLVDAFPAETVAIYRLVKAGMIDEALKIYSWFLPVLELDIHPKLVQYIKLAAQHTGIGTANVRAPRLPLEGEELKAVTAVIEKALATRPVLPDYLNLKNKKDAAWA